MTTKISIRFFNDHEVRAVWDEKNSKWWLAHQARQPQHSATDIVRAINDEEDYKKCRNYWKYLKGKMAKEGIQLVSVTNHFKFMAPDGKQRAADALDAEAVRTLAQHYPNNRANAFLNELDLSNANLEGADLSNAHIGFCNLTGANLRNADLSNAEIECCKVKDADFSGADLSNAQIDSTTYIWLDAITDGETLFPSHHRPSYM